MNVVVSLVVGVLVMLEVSGCGGTVPATCGAAGTRPHPEVGGEILYYCRDWPAVTGRLYLLDVATGQVRALTADSAWNLDGAWSPDGARIAFQSTRQGRDDLFVMDVESGAVRRITDGRGFNEYPAWSPDGRWLSFNSTRDGASGSGAGAYYRDLYVIRPDGSGLRRLTRASGANAEAAWRPDGQALAFQSDRSGQWEIYVMDADGGGGLRRLTHHTQSGGLATFPRWSADGTRIVFSNSQHGEPSSIYLLTVATGELTQVTVDVPGKVFDGWADWTGDGRWIVFARDRDGVQLFAVHPDGSGLTQLTDGPGEK